MLLSSLRLVGLGPFSDLTLGLCDEAGNPRKMIVVLGSGGVGKTSLLSAIATTRPGYCVAQTRARTAGESATSCYAVAEWMLGEDDPTRPHPLRVVSPNVVLEEPETVSQLRRREQAMMDRRAAERGFVLVVFSAARWFSKAPVMLTTPERTVFRYDVRAAPNFDDPARADLARETKQVLSYTAIASALQDRDGAPPVALERSAKRLDEALRQVVGLLVHLAGYRTAGVNPVSLEPEFEDSEGNRREFDLLPAGVRHLVALATLTLRALAAAWPSCNPREAEGVVLVDDADLCLEPPVQQALVPTLQEALPNVQWILTTSSLPLALGCDPGALLALRKAPSSQKIELHQGPLATLH